MAKQYSVTEARQNLAALVHSVERAARIELTRRGKPVAVLLSITEFRRLNAGAGNFWEAYVAFRNAVDVTKLDIGPKDFEWLRD